MIINDTPTAQLTTYAYDAVDQMTPYGDIIATYDRLTDGETVFTYIIIDYPFNLELSNYIIFTSSDILRREFNGDFSELPVLLRNMWNNVIYSKSGSQSELKNVYNSIKESPQYIKGFQEVQNGTKKFKVKNGEVLDELRKVESRE